MTSSAHPLEREKEKSFAGPLSPKGQFSYQKRGW